MSRPNFDFTNQNHPLAYVVEGLVPEQPRRVNRSTTVTASGFWLVHSTPLSLSARGLGNRAIPYWALVCNIRPLALLVLRLVWFI